MATAPRVSYGVGEEQDIAAARKADEPLQRIAQEGQAAEALQQTGVRYAQEQEQKAKANVEAGKAAGEERALGEYAAEQQRLYEKAEKETNPFPSFNPSQEDLTSYAQLGSMIMTAGLLLGNSGKVPAKAALASMTGMLNGWRQGRRDLWDKESKAFEKELSRIKAANQAIESNLKKGLELAATNRELSRQKYMNAAAIAGRNSIIETAIATGRAQDALKRTQESTKLLMEAEKRIQQNAAKNREAREAERRHKESLAAQRAKASQTTQKSTQQQFIVQRAINSLGGVASALESIVNLPEGSTTGWLPNLQTKDGMANAIRNQLGKKISTVDAEMMNTLFSGIGRNLASIEASGTATGLTGLANQLQSGVYINAGVDDPFKVAIKLADVRRIATENIRPSIDAGLMSPDQAKTARNLVERIEKVIPYSTVDVVNVYKQAKRPNSKTIGEAASKVTGQIDSWSDEDEKRLQELERKSRGAQ